MIANKDWRYSNYTTHVNVVKVMVGMLDDCNLKIRLEMHRLLSSATLANHACLSSVVHALVY